jgi:hypothetical protein
MGGIAAVVAMRRSRAREPPAEESLPLFPLLSHPEFVADFTALDVHLPFYATHLDLTEAQVQTLLTQKGINALNVLADIKDENERKTAAAHLLTTIK